MRTQDICSIVGSDILSAEINDENCLGEKNDPVQYEPTSLIFSELRNQREANGPPPIVRGMENSSQVIVNGQDDRIVLDEIRALKEGNNVMLEEVPETKVVEQTSCQS